MNENLSRSKDYEQTFDEVDQQTLALYVLSSYIYWLLHHVWKLGFEVIYGIPYMHRHANCSLSRAEQFVYMLDSNIMFKCDREHGFDVMTWISCILSQAKVDMSQAFK